MPNFSIILGKVLRHSAMFCFRIQSIESQTLLNALRLCLRRYKNLALDKRYTHIHHLRDLFYAVSLSFRCLVFPLCHSFASIIFKHGHFHCRRRNRQRLVFHRSNAKQQPTYPPQTGKLLQKHFLEPMQYIYLPLKDE